MPASILLACLVITCHDIWMLLSGSGRSLLAIVTVMDILMVPLNSDTYSERNIHCTNILALYIKAWSELFLERKIICKLWMCEENNFFKLLVCLDLVY